MIVHWSQTRSTTIVRWSESGRRLLKYCPKRPAMVGDRLRLVSEQSPTYDTSLREVADLILYKFRGFAGLKSFYDCFHFSSQKYTAILHVWGDIYIYPISRGLQWYLLGLRWLHDGRCQYYKVLSNLMLSHDHRTMFAAYHTISRGRSQIVTDYRTMVVQQSATFIRFGLQICYGLSATICVGIN